MTHPLYLSTKPSGVHLILKTHHELIALLPGSNWASSHVPFCRWALMSARAAATHLSASGCLSASARDLGSIDSLVLRVHSTPSTRGIVMSSAGLARLALAKAPSWHTLKAHFKGSEGATDRWCSKCVVRCLTAGGVCGHSGRSGTL